VKYLFLLTRGTQGWAITGKELIGQC